MSIEYSYLLTSQLDSQRIYYERQMDELSANIAKLNIQSKQAILDLDKLQDQKHAIQTENYDKETIIVELTNRKKKAEDQLDEWKEKCDTSKRVLLGEKQVSGFLGRHPILIYFY
jgi:BRCA1-associated protein